MEGLCPGGQCPRMVTKQKKLQHNTIFNTDDIAQFEWHASNNKHLEVTVSYRVVSR